MFSLNKEEKVTIDTVINGCLVQIDDDGDYRGEDVTKMSENLVLLTKAKEQLSRSTTKSQMISGLFSLGGVLSILAFERTGAIGSKSLGFVSKIRA